MGSRLGARHRGGTSVAPGKGSVAGAATVTVTAESLAAAIARKKHTEMERDVGRALLEASLQKRAERARSVSESQYEQDELVGCVEVTP